VHVSGTPEVTLRASVDNRFAANLTAVLVDYGPDAPVMITRGWMDVQNRSGPGRSTPIRQGREYDFCFDLQPDDYVVPAGHRIGHRRRLDGPRLHDPARAGDAADAGPGPQRAQAAGGRRSLGAGVLSTTRRLRTATRGGGGVRAAARVRAHTASARPARA
jgi:X-Pro dipeptidyl-peptidase C-terminal non-catalytic domain